MKFSLRNMSLTLALMVSAAPLMTVHADAKASFMAECSAKFKAAKAANTLGADTKWTDFMKHQCAASTDASAAAPADTAAAPAVKPVKVKKTKAVETPPAADATTTTTPSGSFMQNCSAAWKAMKAANTVPAGMKWKDFVATKCVATSAAATAPAAPVVKSAKKAATAVVTPEVTPPEPTATVDAGTVKTVDKNGKPFTPGQLAAHARARACGAKWRQEKAAGTLQAGLKWPQYWSACNTEMKASGQ
jgi:hypothetical protein